jgi:hypothetical protein
MPGQDVRDAIRLPRMRRRKHDGAFWCGRCRKLPGYVKFRSGSSVMWCGDCDCPYRTPWDVWDQTGTLRRRRGAYRMLRRSNGPPRASARSWRDKFRRL